ncbi:SDR family NAD(P)-dependent oxidoreductase [Pseudomonas sp. N040]|uniref:SDR family NAD(P)-dependent oxidoreductase n=1 Tax=Pseudomonas sp. N040 TaxID=2785325 RepID=UPI0018A305DF|nr:SDR family NAD(P)-dependent oxidoreductase [Pseudomonas sp. N040]MBF7730825.1 SDR family NAD(P)-dependent oxidoreductase [Pseudomonas sp. N040]MBW7014468.1 SDR family NAD(P)-dependent oxidoreductase [Pseudomonas sp. N040]
MSQGKRYLLTGASSGIGEALARELAAAGYDLVLAARRVDSLHLLAAELQQRFGGKIVALPLDVTDLDAAQAIVAQAAQALGGLDGLIANAGIGLAGKVGSGHFANDCRVVQTNLLGAMASLDAATALFRQQGHGHLVAIASVAGKVGLPGNAGYSASKFGVVGYMQTLQAELAGKPIHATLLLPGFIDTPLNRDMHSRPFVIDLQRGAALIARHIASKRSVAYVPGWPWALLAPLLGMLPARLIGKYF